LEIHGAKNWRDRAYAHPACYLTILS